MNLRIKKVINLVIVTFTVTAFTFAHSPEPNNASLAEEVFPELKTILQEVPRSSLRALIAEAQIEEAEGSRIVSKSHLYPHLHADYNFIYGLQSRKDKESSAQFLPKGNITLSQPVYHWGSLTAQKRIGEIRQCMSHQQYDQAIKLLKQELSSLYMSIFLQKKQLAITQENKQSAESDLKDTEAKFALGQVPATQLEEKQINYKETELRTHQAEQQLAYSIEKFRNITQYQGALIEDDPDVYALIDNLPSWMPYFDSENKQESYSCLFLENELNIEELNYKRIRATQLPKFNINGGVLHEMIRGTNTINSVSQVEIFIGANVNWDIFNGFSTKGEKISSKARQRRLRLELERTHNQFEIDISNTERNIEFAYKNIEINKDRFLSAEKNLERHKNKLEKGQISMFQYGSAKNARNHAECQLFSSIIDYLNSLNNYHSLTINL